MTLEEAIAFYQDANHDNTCEVGGFDNELSELNGIVAIAEWCDNDGVRLQMHTAEAFIAWMDRAVDFVDQSSWEDNWSSINETTEPLDAGKE